MTGRYGSAPDSFFSVLAKEAKNKNSIVIILMLLLCYST